MRLVGSSIATIALLAQATTAHADWHYCLAVQAPHRVLLSDPFPAKATTASLEETFAHALAQAGIEHGTVQCPRAESERDIVAMHNHAVVFNCGVGRMPVDLHWSPTRGLEARHESATP